MKKIKFLQILIFSIGFIGVSCVTNAMEDRNNKNLYNKTYYYQNNNKNINNKNVNRGGLQRNNQGRTTQSSGINNTNKNSQNYNNTACGLNFFKGLNLSNFNLRKPSFNKTDTKQTEDRNVNKKSSILDKNINKKNAQSSMGINNKNKNSQNYNNTAYGLNIFNDIDLSNFNLRKPSYNKTDTKQTEDRNVNEKSYNFDKNINKKNDEKNCVYSRDIINSKKSGVIDPQYEVIKGNMRYQYKLDGVSLYTKNNRVRKYKNVKTRELFDELPAADPKFEIRKEADGIFYYYQGEKEYKIEEMGNFVEYINQKDKTLKLFSKKGTKKYQYVDSYTYVESLPIFERESLENDNTKNLNESYIDEEEDIKSLNENDEREEKERLAKIYHYGSPTYDELLQKSQFFRPMDDKQFEEVYFKAYNQYDHMDFYDVVIMDNVANNMFTNPEKYKFVNNFKDRNDKELTSDQLYVKNKFDDEILNKVKAILENIRNVLYSERSNNTNGDEVEHPVYNVINKRDLSFYCLNGKVEYYKIKNRPGYYDIHNNKFFDRLPYFMGETPTYAMKGQNGKLYYYIDLPNNEKDIIDEIVEDNNKIWYLNDGQKGFCCKKGYDYIVNTDREVEQVIIQEQTNTLTKEKEYSCSVCPAINSDYKNKNFNFKTAEDPRYEVIKHEGKNIYFFGGIPKYLKTNGLYYRFSDGKFLKNLPTVDGEDYYAYFKKGNKLYCYINDNIVYEVTEEKKDSKTKIYYSYNGDRILECVKGKKQNIKFKFKDFKKSMRKIPIIRFQKKKNKIFKIYKTVI